jgi:hypothetical protein
MSLNQSQRAELYSFVTLNFSFIRLLGDLIRNLGLVRFMDNWPWKIDVHGQKNIFFISWTMSIVHGHWP